MEQSYAFGFLDDSEEEPCRVLTWRDLMALTLPLPEELDQFSLGATDVFAEDQKTDAIQQAADLLYLATGVTEDPTNATGQILRIISWGLMDMAWKLLVTSENKTEINSPYSSETIGSYSYAKQAAAAIANGMLTGVEWFDAVVKLLNGLSGESVIWSQSEHVFSQPYCEPDPNALRLPDWYGW